MPTNASNGNLLIMTVTKALVILTVVGTVAYCVISQITIDAQILAILVGILTAKEAVSLKVYSDTLRHK